MTALSEYARLESTGLWRPDPETDRREVFVSFGTATLVISDSSDRPLAHWSLPATVRINPGQRPAQYAPDAGDDETLEIADDEMIDAIERVRRALARGHRHPGRLRLVIFAALAAALAALSLLWFPAALRSQTLAAVTPATRSEIGAAILGHIQKETGPACRSPAGQTALAQLAERTFGPGAVGRIIVLPTTAFRSLTLPGGLVLLGRGVIEGQDEPAIPAGEVLAAGSQLQISDPLEAALKTAGVAATLRLYTTGSLPPDLLEDHARNLLGSEPPLASPALLLPLFAGAQIPSAPFASARGETGGELMSQDPMSGRSVPVILSDQDWIGLQGICSD